MSATPSTARQAALRARRKALGYTQVTVYARPIDHPAIRDLASILRAKREAIVAESNIAEEPS